MIGVVHMATGGDGAIHVDQFLSEFTDLWKTGLPGIIMGDFNMDMGKYMESYQAEIITSTKENIKEILEKTQERILAQKSQCETKLKQEKFRKKLELIEKLEAEIQRKQTELDAEERKTPLSRWAAAVPTGTNTTIWTHRPSCLDNVLFLSDYWDLVSWKVDPQPCTAMLSDHQPIGITLKPKSNDD
jgi:endonuclease/exonuclease/phosphatase family metal-dependent hydrolase